MLLIASGKGGVGKSSVTTNLAIALAQRGKSVAVVDADVWGFSIPRMLGVQHAPAVIDGMLVPPETNGVRCISMGFFAEEDTPVIWRGPMLHKALEQFLTDVYWDDPDYLLVDLPPGTGDISISLASFLPRAEFYVVTTPQPAAQKVAQRAGFMAQKVNLTVRGVIENMSWFTGDDGTRYEIFGAGGGAELAQTLEVPLLGQVPLVPLLREGSDNGRPIVIHEPDGEAARCFASIAEEIDVTLAPTRRYHKELKLISGLVRNLASLGSPPRTERCSLRSRCLDGLRLVPRLRPSLLGETPIPPAAAPGRTSSVLLASVRAAGPGRGPLVSRTGDQIGRGGAGSHHHFGRGAP